ncbi:hypothetical protein RZ760_015060 [Providencia rettgeri]|nr:hypothetical protein [Providencia rettgeri]
MNNTRSDVVGDGAVSCAKKGGTTDENGTEWNRAVDGVALGDVGRSG